MNLLFFNTKMFKVVQLYVEYKQHLNNSRVFQNWQKHLVMNSFYFVLPKLFRDRIFNLAWQVKDCWKTICLCHLAGNNYL